MDGKAAPGLRGTPPDAVVFGSKVSVRARYLHIIIWNGYEIVRKARSPLGMPQRGMPGRAVHGRNHAGERLACCIVFFPAILWCAPPTFGGRSVLRSARRFCPASVWDTGTGGARSGCALPTGGEGNIISHNLFYYVNFIPRKEAANSFLPMPCICAIRCNRVASTRNQKVCNTLELLENKYRLVQKRGGIWCQRRSQKGRKEGPLSIPRKTSGATGEKRSHPS